jgi:hypothetical protein
MCLLEAAAYVAGEPWSDSPECVSPVLAAFGRSWNDALDDENRQMLKPFIPRLVGTAARRAADAAWAAAREVLAPTVAEPQQSALRLFDRMITAGSTEASSGQNTAQTVATSTASKRGGSRS